MPKNKKEVTGLTDTWGRKNRKIPDKECESCGITFRPKSSKNRTCSRKCGYAIRDNGALKRRKKYSWRIDGYGFVEGKIWIDEFTQITVKQHRWMMEAHLGRKLLITERVIHKDGNKTNNDISNLQIIRIAPPKEKTITFRIREEIEGEYMKKISKLPYDIKWISINIGKFKNDAYQVSNNGLVRKIKKDGSFKYLAISDNGHGYKFVRLYYKGASFCQTVHRLVALTFIENPDNKDQVNHLNGIRSDNRVENLEWATRDENLAHAILSKAYSKYK